MRQPWLGFISWRVEGALCSIIYSFRTSLYAIGDRCCHSLPNRECPIFVSSTSSEVVVQMPEEQLRRGHLPQHVKFPGWKMHARIYKQYVLRSYRTSTFNAMRFDENPFTCLCEKADEKVEGLQIWYFYWSFSSDIMAAKFARSQPAICVSASFIGGTKTAMRVSYSLN